MAERTQEMDENMSTTTTESPWIPDSVRAANEAADRILNPTPAAESTAVTPDAGQAAPPQAPQAQAPAQPPPAPQIVQEIAELERRRDTIRNEIQTENGRYGAELQKRAAIINQQAETIKAQQAEIAALKAAGTAEAPAAQPAKVGDEWREFYTAEEIASWGEEYCKADYARHVRITAKKVAPAQDVAELTAMKTKLQEFEHQQAIQRQREFLNTMDRLCPGFSDLNGSDIEGIPADPFWLQFLSTTEPSTGLTWRELATIAYNKANWPRLADIARKCMELRSSPASAGAPGGAGQQVPRLESQFAPPTVHVQPPNPGDAGQRVVRQSEIDAFNAEIVANPTRYSPEDRTKRLNEFQTAMLAGRYVDDRPTR